MLEECCGTPLALGAAPIFGRGEFFRFALLRLCSYCLLGRFTSGFLLGLSCLLGLFPVSVSCLVSSFYLSFSVSVCRRTARVNHRSCSVRGSVGTTEGTLSGLGGSPVRGPCQRDARNVKHSWSFCPSYAGRKRVLTKNISALLSIPGVLSSEFPSSATA